MNRQERMWIMAQFVAAAIYSFGAVVASFITESALKDVLVPYILGAAFGALSQEAYRRFLGMTKMVRRKRR